MKSLTQKTKNQFPEGLKKKLYKKCIKFKYPKVAHHNKNIVCESEVLNTIWILWALFSKFRKSWKADTLYIDDFIYSISRQRIRRDKKCIKFKYPKVAHHNKNIVCESEVLNIWILWVRAYIDDFINSISRQRIRRDKKLLLPMVIHDKSLWQKINFDLRKSMLFFFFKWPQIKNTRMEENKKWSIQSW